MSPATLGSDGVGQRRFRSPNRILARSFRLARDRWKQKHQVVQAQLIQARRLATEREASRQMWRARCEAATARAEVAEERWQQQSLELQPARARLVEQAAVAKKKYRRR